MSRREQPAALHEPKRPVGEHAGRRTAAPAQAGRCFGAAAQLAAVHRTVRHGALCQFQTSGNAGNAETLPMCRAVDTDGSSVSDRSKAVFATPATASPRDDRAPAPLGGSTAGGIIQRTKWIYDIDRWKLDTPGPDPVGSLSPEVYAKSQKHTPHTGDTYDQATGSYVEIKAGRRRKTMFGAMAKGQGPHTFPEIGVQGALNRGAAILNQDPLELLGTAAALRPGAAYRQLEYQIIYHRGKKKISDKEKKRIKDGLFKWKRLYNKYWLAANDIKKNGIVRHEAFRKLVELQPTTTYNNIKGINSPAELSGKGEREKGALLALAKVWREKRLKGRKGVEKMVQSGSSVMDLPRGDTTMVENASRRLGALGEWSMGGQVPSSDTDISSRDTDDLEEAIME